MTLRNLVRDGRVTRRVGPTVPSRVRYRVVRADSARWRYRAVRHTEPHRRAPGRRTALVDPQAQLHRIAALTTLGTGRGFRRRARRRCSCRWR
ncbi:hypothetical protein [Streptomyces sp. M92]